jgi:hypothetical protein
LTGRGTIRSKLYSFDLIASAAVTSFVDFVIKPHFSSAVFILFFVATYGILVGGSIYAGTVLDRRYALHAQRGYADRRQLCVWPGLAVPSRRRPLRLDSATPEKFVGGFWACWLSGRGG